MNANHTTTLVADAFEDDVVVYYRVRYAIDERRYFPTALALDGAEDFIHLSSTSLFSSDRTLLSASGSWPSPFVVRDNEPDTLLTNVVVTMDGAEHIRAPMIELPLSTFAVQTGKADFHDGLLKLSLD